MPAITFKNKTISCKQGEILRDALHRHKLNVHNGHARLLNCRGFGSCGTCAVKILGKVNPHTVKEQIRLSFPPHCQDNGLRLACQVSVTEDLVITKYPGFWGEQVK